MKKILTFLFILFTLSVSYVFADKNETDPFDTLIEKLLKDFEIDDEGEDDIAIAVKVFNGDLGLNERKRISKSVQFALYCTDDIEIASSSINADYICTGRVEADGPNYIVSAKIVDAYDDTVISKAKQKVPKNYYATSEVTKVETIVVEKEDEIGADDILGAVIVGSVIGGVFHAVTAPHHHHVVPAPVPVPVPRPKPAPKRKPRRP